MRIAELHVLNYRSIENLKLVFPTYYSAICGKNDAGKSNIIRVLRFVFSGPEKYYFGPERTISFKDDFTKWKEADKDPTIKRIQFQFTLEIDPSDDEGLYRFIVDYLKIPPSELPEGQKISLKLGLRFSSEHQAPLIAMTVLGQPTEQLRAQEVLNKIQASFTVLFHDSTDSSYSFELVEASNLFRELTGTETSQIAQAKAKLDKVLSKIAKRNQQDLTAVLGRLKDKYRLGISLDRRRDNESEVPYSVTLGNEDVDVELEGWGSGTQNRTRILMTMFKAKLVRESETSASKVTPVIVIEEPESYLHPSAQAEFGLILRDLADEFKIQVIVTTHSPYLLSLDEPSSNILLERKVVKKKVRATEVKNTSGTNWIEPFSLALGLGGSELAPWKDALFTAKDAVLLVEGDTDKEYLSLLTSADHGDQKLAFDGIIFAYGGKDTLRQKQLLRFIKSRFKKFLVTYDLDCESEIENHLKEMDLVKGRDYISIGRDLPGKKSIEGLLPESVLQSVYGNNVDLVQKATAGSSNESRSAKSALKRLFLEEFRSTVEPQSEGYKSFYALAKQLNRMS